MQKQRRLNLKMLKNLPSWLHNRVALFRYEDFASNLNPLKEMRDCVGFRQRQDLVECGHTSEDTKIKDENTGQPSCFYC